MFRLVNVESRAALEHDGGWYDLAAVSGDAALADPMVAVARHRELHGFAAECAGRVPDGAVADVLLGPPVPQPAQAFGIGLNYRDHADETSATLPPAPLTFTKFPSCITGPTAEIPLSGDRVDWEVEIVAVIGARVSHVAVRDAWDAVAGLMLGQDVSDRTVQKSGTPPQFSLGKSFANYGPTGPALVSLDAFANRDDITLWCDVAGERMQASSTAHMIFPIPVLVAYLSSIVTLQAGDIVFTGTPSGVGMARNRFLQVGEVIDSGADVIGALRNRCVAGHPPLTV